MKTRPAAALLALATLCSACALDEEPRDEGLDQLEIDNGSPTNQYAAVGTLSNRCSATLIGPRTILTAAHCLPDDRIDVFRAGGAEYRVIRESIHPYYNPALSGFDAAVLVLDRAAGVAPIRIDHQGAMKVGDWIAIVGFGGTAEDPTFGTKRVGKTTIDRIEPDYFGFDSQGGTATLCPGDSGGPSILAGRVAGIHSASLCGDNSLDARVSVMRAWIVSQSVYPFSMGWHFVSQQYADLLARPGDGPGVGYYVDRLEDGTFTPAGVAASLIGSAEAGQFMGPVVRCYVGLLLRPPDPAGLDYWLGQMRAGLPASEVTNAIAGSAEFHQRTDGLDNGGYVTYLYVAVLGRAPDSGGYAYWVGQLDSGAMSRAVVAGALVHSPEAIMRLRHDVVVSAGYARMLRRSPDAAGYAYWRDGLRSGAQTIESMMSAFLNTSEYAARFGGR